MNIIELAKQATFEEVAYMLIHGELPTPAQLSSYHQKLKKLRGLPDGLKKVLEQIPANAHPMDVMRTGCSMLGTLEPESADRNIDAAKDLGDRLIACFGSILIYWYHFSHNGKRIDVESDENSIAAHFLYLLHGKKPSALHISAMNTSLVLYAEHELHCVDLNTAAQMKLPWKLLSVINQQMKQKQTSCSEWSVKKLLSALVIQFTPSPTQEMNRLRL